MRLVRNFILAGYLRFLLCVIAVCDKYQKKYFFANLLIQKYLCTGNFTLTDVTPYANFSTTVRIFNVGEIK